MEKEQIIKYVAIAAGAYLIYTFMRDAGYLDGLFGAAAPAADGAATDSAKPPVSEPSKPPLSSSSPSNPPAGAAPPSAVKPTGEPFTGNLQNRLRQRMGNDIGSAFTADQWSYYANEVTGVPVPASLADALFTPGNREEKITLATYLSRRTAAGISNDPPFTAMSGMGYYGGYPFQSPWAT